MVAGQPRRNIHLSLARTFVRINNRSWSSCAWLDADEFVELLVRPDATPDDRYGLDTIVSAAWFALALGAWLVALGVRCGHGAQAFRRAVRAGSA